jgi:two-component system response regulator (stage 0 sporulation protein A)
MELTGALTRYLSGSGRFEIVGTACDGEQGLRLLRSGGADVALISLVLPRKDGFYILDELSKTPANMPCCIMLSAIGKSNISQTAMDKGADFFILKPFDLDYLATRIDDVWGWRRNSVSDASLSNQMTLKIPETYALQVLHELPIPYTQEGYAYIKTALLLSIEEPELLNMVTKGLYPAVGRQHSIDAAQAERSMRYAIATAWRKGGGTAFANILGREKSDLPRPSISAFISALVEKYNCL